MKDRVREAVFNLVGPAVRDRQVVDLFGGTGAMSFEAISRGAKQAVVIERKFPNVRLIQENAATLGIGEQLDVRAGDTFLQYNQLELGDDPWLVFCCPPYEFYASRTAELVELVEWFCDGSPRGSLIVVESDQRFDSDMLPNADTWDVRFYPPAVIGIFEKRSGS
jgi:16S rRNA (guanine(966)-N(2))-methyltransferase RsmD